MGEAVVLLLPAVQLAAGDDCPFPTASPFGKSTAIEMSDRNARGSTP